MAIIKLRNMALVAQNSDGTCWCASAIMLHKWAQKSGYLRMIDPLSNSGVLDRWTNNKGWGSYDNEWLATTLNMIIQSSIPVKYNGLNDLLHEHGPIWAGGLKTWTGDAYGHVVVICGVADTGVFIFDPEPVKKGSSRWLTWHQLDKFIQGETATSQFLTAI